MCISTVRFPYWAMTSILFQNLYEIGQWNESNSCALQLTNGWLSYSRVSIHWESWSKHWMVNISRAHLANMSNSTDIKCFHNIFLCEIYYSISNYNRCLCYCSLPPPLTIRHNCISYIYRYIILLVHIIMSVFTRACLCLHLTLSKFSGPPIVWNFPAWAVARILFKTRSDGEWHEETYCRGKHSNFAWTGSTSRL